MNQFSISQLAQFSGVKPHTIRIWEQRYNALQPERSEGNTRHYDGEQLRRLLNIVSLMKTRYKVSQLCRMEDDRLNELLKENFQAAAAEGDHDYFVNLLVAAGLNYDEQHFDKIFSHCLLKFGMINTYRRVIYPLLEKIGMMWLVNSIPPAQEHFLSNLLRQKLFTAIDALPPVKEGTEHWILFLPENEFHEIGLLFANYLIRSRGIKTTYLGHNVPLHSMKPILNDQKADKMLLFFVHKDLPKKIEVYLQQLKAIGSRIQIFVAADSELAEAVPAQEGVKFLTSIEDLEQFLPAYDFSSKL